MYRILPATSLAAVLAIGCATAPSRRASRLGVTPVSDPALYECAQRTASDLGFNRQMRGSSGRGALLATTDTNRVTGEYDELRVRILSDTSRVTTWVTASPYSGVARREPNGAQVMPSRRAIEAAATVEQRCRSVRSRTASRSPTTT
jgi:hypothetical protein